jgi:hypothetical protein
VSAVTPNGRRNDRGNCQGIDQRQIFNLSAVFQAPKFASGWKKRPLTANRFARWRD